MRVHLEIQYTAADVMEANNVARRHFRRERGSGRRFLRDLSGWVAFLGLLALLKFVISQRGIHAGDLSSKSEPLPWIVICGLVAGVVVSLIRQHWFPKTQFPWSSDLLAVDIDDELIVLKSPTSKTEFQWTAFEGFDESASCFVLFVENARTYKLVHFLPIPKRTFPSAEMCDDFARALNANLRMRAGASPVLRTLPVPTLPTKSRFDSQS
jgi:hypothetical protein